MALLKSTPPTGKLVGSVNIEMLCDDLSTKDSFPVPFTFARARTLVGQTEKGIRDCLIQGFSRAEVEFHACIQVQRHQGGEEAVVEPKGLCPGPMKRLQALSRFQGRQPDPRGDYGAGEGGLHILHEPG